jgi:tetratricopeptide (TPR) repeat protein
MIALVRIVKRACCILAMWQIFALSAQANSTLEDEITRLLNASQFEAAQALLAQTPHSTADQLLLEGRIAKLTGRLDEAISLLERALSQARADLRIRRELAHTQLLAQKLRPAKRHLEHLLRVETDPALRLAYVGMLNDIAQARPVHWETSFALSPSNNVNRGTGIQVITTAAGEEFIIGDDTKESSGVRASLSFGGTIRLSKPQLSAHTKQTHLKLQFAKTHFSNDTKFNYETATLGLSHQILHPNASWTITPSLRQEWHKREGSHITRSLKLDYVKRLSTQRRWWSSLLLEDRDYEGSPDYRRNLDGTYSLFSLGTERQLSNRLSFSGSLSFEAVRPHNHERHYEGISLSGQLSRSWQNGITSHVFARLGARQFNGAFAFYEEPRSDRHGMIGVALEHNAWRIWGAAPVLRCTYEKQSSNSAIYSFDATGCGLSLSRKF